MLRSGSLRFSAPLEWQVPGPGPRGRLPGTRRTCAGRTPGVSSEECRARPEWRRDLRVWGRCLPAEEQAERRGRGAWRRNARCGSARSVFPGREPVRCPRFRAVQPPRLPRPVQPARRLQQAPLARTPWPVWGPEDAHGDAFRRATGRPPEIRRIELQESASRRTAGSAPNGRTPLP